MLPSVGSLWNTRAAASASAVERCEKAAEVASSLDANTHLDAIVAWIWSTSAHRNNISRSDSMWDGPPLLPPSPPAMACVAIPLAIMSEASMRPPVRAAQQPMSLGSAERKSVPPQSGTIPRTHSGMLKNVVGLSVQMRVAADMKRPPPAPMMQPSARAMTGILRLSPCNASMSSYSRRRNCLLWVTGSAAAARISPPAQNAFPCEALSRRAVTSGLDWSCLICSVRPSTSSLSSAFSFDGRLRHNSSTPPGPQITRSGVATAAV
mmetsp:Transcript_16955/g.43563  ORF Transcript_16955/g.43563 Transcript_16955/m.43563 type:complete len:265 (+) Transcript_16955:593-1387(+)